MKASWMTAELSLVQRLHVCEGSPPPKDCHNPCLDIIFEPKINNTTNDTLWALKVLLKALFPSFPYLNN